jgi:hypothetical protein
MASLMRPLGSCSVVALFVDRGPEFVALPFGSAVRRVRLATDADMDPIRLRGGSRSPLRSILEKLV